MTPEEIRNRGLVCAEQVEELGEEWAVKTLLACAVEMLIEIAAQLAEINGKVEG